MWVPLALPVLSFCGYFEVLFYLEIAVGTSNTGEASGTQINAILSVPPGRSVILCLVQTCTNMRLSLREVHCRMNPAEPAVRRI